jgi:hypothetical protein
MINSLTVDGAVLTDPEEMEAATFAHYDGLLGTEVVRDCTIDLADLITPAALDDLDVPFVEDEIWQTVKRLPARKAPGPDGFTAEFLRSCWNVVKHDFVSVFQQLYELRGHGFCRLNQVLLTLITKCADATGLGDFRPIRLISPI